MRTAVAAVTVVLVAFASVAATTVARADTAAGGRAIGFPEHGFAIDPPVGHDTSQMQQVVTLMLPATDGFSPNVNVQVQPFSGTMAEYLTVSQEQFKAGGITLLSEKHDERVGAGDRDGARVAVEERERGAAQVRRQPAPAVDERALGGVNRDSP